MGQAKHKGEKLNMVRMWQLSMLGNLGRM